MLPQLSNKKYKNVPIFSPSHYPYYKDSYWVGSHQSLGSNGQGFWDILGVGFTGWDPALKALIEAFFKLLGWVLPPLSNSWIIFIVYLYIALNMTPSIGCYWVGAVPNF